MRRVLLTVSAAGLLAVLTACMSTTGTVSTTPASQVPAAPSPGTASTAVAKKAGVGDAIDLKGEKSGDLIEVTLVKIVDPDSANDGFSTPPAGDRYVSVQFRIVNKGTGAYQDDPMIDITVKDASGQSMKQDYMSSTSAGAQMDSSVNLAPSDKALGFVTFDVPTGDKIGQVQYALNAGMFGNSGEWQVG